MTDNDAAVLPTITVTTPGHTTTADAAVAPFVGVTIGDTNSGATDTLTITLSDAGLTGALSGSPALINNGGGVYTLAAAPAATITSELNALVFTPAPGAPGSSTTTTFTLSDASSAGTTSAPNNTITVTDNDAAVLPTITVTTPGHTTTADAAVAPFVGVTIGDTNSGATDTLTITLSDAGLTGALSGSPALINNGGGVYTLAAAPAATITSELNALVFTPAPGAPGSSTTTTFTLSDASSAGTTSAPNNTITVTDNDAAVLPTITVTTPGHTTTADAAVAPFVGVTIGDTNSGATDTLTITLSDAGLTGALSGSPALINNGGGVYTLAAAPAATITSELNALVFTPAPGAPGSSTTTTFTLSDASSAGTTSAPNNTITVTDNDAAVLPTITVTTPGHTTTADAAVAPFVGVTIGDTNSGATDTLTITLSDAGLTGALSGSPALINNGGGVYTLAAAPAATITSELNALVFTPAPGAPGSSTTTTFTLSDASSAGTTSAPNNTITVTDNDAAVLPTITVTTPGHTTTADAAVAPFVGVTIGDTNSGATDTLTITLSDAGLTGALSGSPALINNGGGVYTLAAAPAATITSELNALVFTPAPGAPGSSTTTTFTLSDASSAGTTSAPNNTITVTDNDAAVLPTITVTTPGTYHDRRRRGRAVRRRDHRRHQLRRHRYAHHHAQRCWSNRSLERQPGPHQQRRRRLHPGGGAGRDHHLGTQCAGFHPGSRRSRLQHDNNLHAERRQLRRDYERPQQHHHGDRQRCRGPADHHGHNARTYHDRTQRSRRSSA